MEPPPARPAEGPGQLITFLFTDVVGSTAAWESHPAAMGRAMVMHDQIVERAVAQWDGRVVRPRGEGDSRFVVFDDAGSALRAAVALGLDLAAAPWPAETPIAVRSALHTGPAERRAGDYYGSAVNRCARLRALARPGQVLATEVTVELGRRAVGDEVEATDLGIHWLKDLNQPERVFQVDPAGDRQTFPPLESRAPAPAAVAALPAPVSTFVGRQDEVAAVVALAADPGVRLLTVTGPGGVGKTRVAIAVAGVLRPERGAAVHFVDLTAVTDPGLAPAALVAALQIPDRADQAPLDALVERLGPEPGPLLVLDNLEQVLGIGPFLTELCRQAPDLTILATSRSPLRVSGEVEYPVAPLDLPDPATTETDAIACASAVELFTTRCQAHRPDFALTAGNAKAVAEICARLDGLPLAIELAAARIKLLDPAQLLARLDQRLQFLVGGEHDLPDRQRTLRSTLEWSDALLDDDHRRLLARLGVFVGSFSLESAEIVCGLGPGHPDVLDLLSGLVDASLVQPVEDAARLRFRLLQTVQDYALEQLARRGESDATRKAHAEHVLARTLERAAVVHQPEAPLAFSEARADDGNVRAARAYLASHDPAAGAELVIALRPFWVANGQLTEGRSWAAAALSTTAIADRLRARLLVVAGVLACYQDAMDEARPLLHEGLAVARAVDDAPTVALALCFLGTVAAAQGVTVDAIELGEEAREIAARNDLYEASTQSLALLAMCAGIEGRFDDEKRLHTERLDVARRHGDPARTADALNTLAEIALDDGDIPAARAAATEALERARGTSLLTVRDAQLTLGRAALAEADTVIAAGSFADALTLSAELAQPFELALCLRGAAATACCAGDPLVGAQLAGGAQAVRDPDGDAFPVEQDLDAVLDAARAEVGDGPFDEAFARGAHLERPAVLALAERALAIARISA